MNGTIDTIENMANVLDGHPDYRIQRRMPAPTMLDAVPEGASIGVVTDVETTGIEITGNEVIELALVPFAYDREGRILGLLPSYEGFRQPGRPIPAEITEITGITDDMVRGRTLDHDAMTHHVARATHVIAHNARFDRPFLERTDPSFVDAAWACSLSQVEWRKNGYEGAKLSHLLAQAGYFHDAHRARDDCHAVIHLLGLRMKDGRTALAHLLEAADRPMWRIHAVGSPFDSKDELKARGYRWAGPEGRPPKCWSKDVADREAEIAYLQKEVYRRATMPVVQAIDARMRFSGR